MSFGIEGGFEHRENRLFDFSLGIPVMCHHDRELKHHLKQEVHFYFILFLQGNVLA